ncbi:hypothetical protein OF83DRAFT_1168284 [Amylostereum chailletii]|nr:hypothetical protein OF83DRAFT_1168284 [Amylostereum chailletii]
MAQTIVAPDTCSPNPWSFNSLEQPPCIIAAYVLGVCHSGGNFTIPSLAQSSSYQGPTEVSGPEQENPCTCNSVAYSLVSACASCQGQNWISWQAWTVNCTSNAPVLGRIPSGLNVPDATRIPHWALQNVTTTGTWNLQEAQAAGDGPELGPSSNSTSPGGGGGGGGGSNAGAIAGGVVGGVVGAALLAGLAAWFILRRRRLQHTAPSQEHMAQTDYGNTVTPYPIGNEYLPKLYNPSDPTTYPGATPTATGSPDPTINTTHQPGHAHGPSYGSDGYYNPSEYRGLPEV